MAEKEVYIGSVGPFLFEDTDTYEDGKTRRGIRVNQMYVEDAPATVNEVARSVDLSSSGSSIDSKQDSKIASNSLVVSGLESTTGSKDMSQSVLISGLESKDVSQSVLLSGADSKDVSQSVIVSSLESKVDSLHP